MLSQADICHGIFSIRCEKTAEKLSLKIVFTIFYPFPARSLPPLKGCHHFQIATYKKDL